jgi:hypothetical protein
MNKRKGFVSNSSTASFVIMGFDASGIFDETMYGPEFKGEDFWELAEELGFDHLYGDEGGAPKGVDYVIGRYIMYVQSDSYSTDDGVVDLDTAREFVEKMRAHFGVEDREIKLWKGTCAC